MNFFTVFGIIAFSTIIGTIVGAIFGSLFNKLIKKNNYEDIE